MQYAGNVFEDGGRWRAARERTKKSLEQGSASKSISDKTKPTHSHTFKKKKKESYPGAVSRQTIERQP